MKLKFKASQAPLKRDCLYVQLGYSSELGHEKAVCSI